MNYGLGQTRAGVGKGGRGGDKKKHGFMGNYGGGGEERDRSYSSAWSARRSNKGGGMNGMQTKKEEQIVRRVQAVRKSKRVYLSHSGAQLRLQAEKGGVAQWEERREKKGKHVADFAGRSKAGAFLRARTGERGGRGKNHGIAGKKTIGVGEGTEQETSTKTGKVGTEG